jgi:hypothetical protein
MEKLEQLKKEMLDARQSYETFKQQNSRELTDEERGNEPHRWLSENTMTPIFGFGVLENSETRVFELTKDKLDEMKQLELRMKETHKNYVEYLMESKK